MPAAVNRLYGKKIIVLRIWNNGLCAGNKNLFLPDRLICLADQYIIAGRFYAARFCPFKFEKLDSSFKSIITFSGEAGASARLASAARFNPAILAV